MRGPWWATLALVLISGAAAAEPAVFWFNDPVGPDETVLVTGADLDVVTAVSLQRLGDTGAEGESSNPQSATLLQRNPRSLKFVVPREMAAGIYRVTLSHPDGTLSIRLNAPIVYWVQAALGQAAVPGGWIRLFGRNIVRHDKRARLRLVSESGAAFDLAPSSGDRWSAQFLVPETALPGRYRLRFSNGEGGTEEAVDAGEIQIRAADRSEPASFDVRAYGALGDGTVDDTKAIVAALEAAGNAGGGTVHLRRGRYLVSGQLVVPPGVSLVGERTDLVSVVWPDLPNPPDALVKGSTRFAVRDLTIYASNHRHVLSGGFIGADTVVPDATDIEIRRVRIRASIYFGRMTAEDALERFSRLKPYYPNVLVPDTVRLSGRNVVLADSDILGSGRSLYLLKVSDAAVSHTTLSAGRYGAYSIAGANRLIFEDNVVTSADLQGSGGAINTNSLVVTASENVFVARNIFKSIYGHDREAVTTDGPGGYYFGRVATTAPDRLALDGDLTDESIKHLTGLSWLGVGAAVMVVDGRGAGSFARVAAFEKGLEPGRWSVRLDRSLPVPLDASSVITIVKAQLNYLIVDNLFEDTGPAVQVFGTALNHVIAGNRSVRSMGFLATGLYYDALQPCWQVQLLDNRIVEGSVYRAMSDRKDLAYEAAVMVQGLQPTNAPGRPPLVQSIIVRGNQLDEDAHIAVRGYSAPSPGVRDVVVEANRIGASRVGLVVDAGVAFHLARRNSVGRIPR